MSAIGQDDRLRGEEPTLTYLCLFRWLRGDCANTLGQEVDGSEHVWPSQWPPLLVQPYLPKLSPTPLTQYWWGFRKYVYGILRVSTGVWTPGSYRTCRRQGLLEEVGHLGVGLWGVIIPGSFRSHSFSSWSGYFPRGSCVLPPAGTTLLTFPAMMNCIWLKHWAKTNWSCLLVPNGAGNAWSTGALFCGQNNSIIWLSSEGKLVPCQPSLSFGALSRLDLFRWLPLWTFKVGGKLATAGVSHPLHCTLSLGFYPFGCCH